MDDNTINTIARKVAAIIQHDVTPIYDKPLYTTAEAAAFLGVKRSYIYELIRANKIPYYRSKGGKMIYIQRTDLLKWAQTNFIPSVNTRNQSDAHG
jgi:excisionase family DNA binding protein